MDRIKELEECVKEYRENRIKSKQVGISELLLELTPQFQNKLKLLLDMQIRKQGEDKANKTKIKFIYLCLLLSSVYTGSHEAILGISDSKLYLDENKSEIYWSPEIIYRNLDEDMKTVEKLLRKSFLRLEEFELFYIKQKFISDDREVLQECFRIMSKQSFLMITGSPLQLENELLFLCGNYMDNLKIIHYIERRKNNG